jgi:hypothetical protein
MENRELLILGSTGPSATPYWRPVQAAQRSREFRKPAAMIHELPGGSACDNMIGGWAPVRQNAAELFGRHWINKWS